MLVFRRAPARPRQAVVVALVRTADCLLRQHVEVFLVRHVRLQPLRRLTAVAGGPAAAVDLGAELHPREKVIDIEPLQNGGARVKTDAGTYEAGSVVLSPGPWITKFIPHLAGIAQPYRQVFGWFRPLKPDLFTRGQFPSFTLKIPEGHYYGFPLHGHPGLKVGGPHHGREPCDPDTLIRENRLKDEVGLRDCLSRYMPEAMGPALTIKTCIYTMTPDEDFIIDHLPGAPQIVIASPCSGHGFKFASVMGEILSDLSLGQKPPYDFTPFRLDRFTAQTK